MVAWSLWARAAVAVPAATSGVSVRLVIVAVPVPRAPRARAVETPASNRSDAQRDSLAHFGRIPFLSLFSIYIRLGAFYVGKAIVGGIVRSAKH
jgi:hypothetical protein